MSKRYEREIEEIMRRQRREGGGERPPGPVPFTPRPARPAPPSFPALTRLFVTTAEQLVVLAYVLGFASYLLRLAPGLRLLPGLSLPMLVALAAVIVLTVAIVGAGFRMLPQRGTRYWRDRPIDIAAGKGLAQQLAYSWWRTRVALRRLFGGRR